MAPTEKEGHKRWTRILAAYECMPRCGIGDRTCTPMMVDVLGGQSRAQPTSNRHMLEHGVHMCVPIIRSPDKGAYGSLEESIYGLPLSFEVAKSSPHMAPCQLPIPCFA
jgi:hypothetical protein